MSSASTQRVVALVDMDCFYCQVETRSKPELKGKPLAVVQYNQAWKGGGIIAVNYEARGRGVSRYMRGTEAKEICPEIILVPVPTVRGKADLTKYRDAGDEVAKVFSEFSDCVQRASIDEAFLDLTGPVEEAIKNQIENNEALNQSDLPSTFVVGYSDLKNNNESERRKGLTQWLSKLETEETNKSPDYHLTAGAKIVEKMRSEILKRTGFHCSAGIAHNKILAKLVAGLHKPQRQTILPQDALPELYDTLPIEKVRNLGGKLGKQVANKLSINYMSELYNFSLGQLQQKFDEKTSYWLYNIARGIDLDPVVPRLTPESIGCCKNFRGKSTLKTKSEVEHWVKELSSEISERLFKDLEKNNRRAKQLIVSFSQKHVTNRCGPLNSYEVEKIAGAAVDLIKKFSCTSENEDVWTPPISYLGLSATKFTEEISSSIERYLRPSGGSGNSVRLQDLPSCSKTPKEESKKYSDLLYSLKKIKAMSGSNSPTTIKNSRSSFFLEYLSTKTPSGPAKKMTGDREAAGEKEVEEGKETETWISLTELFPDVNEAEPEVVENLPEPLKEKLKKLVNVTVETQEISENSIPEALPNNGAESSVEVCQDCGRNVPASEFNIHLDYHVALNLYSEINKPPRNSVKGILKKPEDKESLVKRKKREDGASPKKIRRLTTFFAPLAKP